MSKKSNFSIGPIIILILIIVHLVRQGHINDWLNQSKPNRTLIEQKHKLKQPEWQKSLIEKLKKEGKIKDKNIELKKPINPNK